MKGIRSLFRLGALAMIAVLLIVALTVPTVAASDICGDDQMLDEVKIKSVGALGSREALGSRFTWDAADLLSYGDGGAGTYPTGQMEVKFWDINTAHRITHYDVIATPSDEPGTSDELGIDEVTTEVARPSEVGSIVTTVLDLEPGTNYVVDVVAVYYNVQISPHQGNQDAMAATTFLSPPFLGSGTGTETDAPMSPSDDGVHYLVYKSDQELHTLRWLNPKTYGPFDHTWKDGTVGDKGADILCSNDDGDLEDDCSDVVGVSHYRVTVTDTDGDVEYVELVKESDAPVYSSSFDLNDGTYTFAVDAGYESDGNFYPLSDKAQVEFDIPDDYRKYNQDKEEINALLDDILGTVNGEKDDFDAFYDSVWNYQGYEDDGSDDLLNQVKRGALKDSEGTVTSPALDEDGAKKINRQNALIIYLNNLYN